MDASIFAGHESDDLLLDMARQAVVVSECSKHLILRAGALHFTQAGRPLFDDTRSRLYPPAVNYADATRAVAPGEFVCDNLSCPL